MDGNSSMNEHILLRAHKRAIYLNAECESCGYDDPLVLDRLGDGSVILCRRCRLAKCGRSTIEAHHLAGRANHPKTISVDANGHARLTALQVGGWPRPTLRNPHRDPLLKSAALMRALHDLHAIGLLEDHLDDIMPLMREAAEQIESIGSYLAAALGATWHRGWEEARDDG